MHKEEIMKFIKKILSVTTLSVFLFAPSVLSVEDATGVDMQEENKVAEKQAESAENAFFANDDIEDDVILDDIFPDEPDSDKREIPAWVVQAGIFVLMKYINCKGWIVGKYDATKETVSRIWNKIHPQK